MTSTSDPTRNTFGTKKYYKKPYKKNDNSKQMERVAKKVFKDMEKSEVEVKRFRVYGTAVNMTSAGTVFSLSTVTAGTGASNRIGNSLTLKSLLVRYSISQNGYTNQCRVIIFRWNSDGVPTVTDVLPYDSSVYWLEPINPDRTESVQVLYDQLVVTGNSSLCHAVYVDKAYISLKGKSSYTTSGNDKGNIYMFIMSDQLVSGFPYMQYYSRLRFTDQ